MEPNTDKFKQYADLVKQQKDIEAQIDVLKKYFKNVLEEEQAEQINSDYGTISMCRRRNYTYPDEVLIKDNELKKLKEEAEARGTATYTETTFIRFDLAK